MPLELGLQTSVLTVDSVKQSEDSVPAPLSHGPGPRAPSSDQAAALPGMVGATSVHAHGSRPAI